MHLWPLDLQYNKASYEGKTRKEQKERKKEFKKRKRKKESIKEKKKKIKNEKKKRRKKETDHPTMITVPVDCVEIV